MSIKKFTILLIVIITVAIILSLIWKISYIFTLIGFASWFFVGHLITADDDVTGGFSNPDGSLPFPWVELVIKGVVLLILCLLAVIFPEVRNLGSA